ncbi:MAG: cytochrome P450 [Ruminococcus sp.]|nr:cytochrome P450 [Ruminococcus sp.]MDE6679104.1 cytochrome P450 [Ruminococcus sp.]
MSDIIKNLVDNFVEIYNVQERFLGGGIVLETDEKWIKMRCETDKGSVIRIIKIDVIGRISCCDD